MSGWVNDFGDPHRPQLHLATLGDLDDSGVQQLASATGFLGHVIGQAVRRQGFGLSSVPPAGAEGLFLASGGRSDRGHLLGLEHPDHKPLGTQLGGTVLYDAYGTAVSLVQKNLRMVHASDIQVTVGGMLVRVRKDRVDIGAMEAPNAVVTTAGPSTKVFSV